MLGCSVVVPVVVSRRTANRQCATWRRIVPSVALLIVCSFKGKVVTAWRSTVARTPDDGTTTGAGGGVIRTPDGGTEPVTCATSVAVSVIGERKSIPSKYAKRQQADELFVPHADLPWAGLARLLQAGAILRHSNRRYDAAKEYCTPVK